MSLLTSQGRISVNPFARVPPLGGLPGITPAPASVDISSRRGVEDGVDLSEGCLVTKTLKYTHEKTHWISAIRQGDPTQVVSMEFKNVHRWSLDTPFSSRKTSCRAYVSFPILISHSTIHATSLYVRLKVLLTDTVESDVT